MGWNGGYITPYYNSKGPVIDVGPFSERFGREKRNRVCGDNRENEKVMGHPQFRRDVHRHEWPFYDLGFRKESIYWFYWARIADVFLRVSSIGTRWAAWVIPGSNCPAQNAFQQLVGPYINGYAFGDIDQLVPIIEKVQREGKVVPDLTKIYPRVTFKPKSEWDAGNKGLNEGLTKLLVTLKNEKASIKQQRIERGMEAKFSKLPSKDLQKDPGYNSAAY